MKEILYEEKITKKDDLFIFERNNKFELTKEDIEKNTKTLTENIKVLKEMLQNSDIKKELEEESKKMDVEREMRQEAYDDFEKYFAENLAEIQNNKEKEKLGIKNYLENFDEAKKILLQKKENDLKAQKEAYEFQLIDEENSLGIYEKIEL